jgi:hypothetical protein
MKQQRTATTSFCMVITGESCAMCMARYELRPLVALPLKSSVVTVCSKAKQSRYMLCGAWGERKYSSYSFMISALAGGEWSSSRPGRTLPRRKDPRYPLYRRLGGPQSRSGHRGYRKKILCPFWRSNPDLPVVQSLVRHYTD